MILIIDSEKVPEAKVKLKFSEYAFQSIAIAKTAAQAREVLINKTNEITLIIIDSELEDANGFELCREIKKTDVGKAAYIMIMVSSIENKTAIEKAKHSGANNFSVKPYMSALFQKHFIHYQMQRVVFLVEDDPIIQQIIKGIVRLFNMETIIADDGNQASNLINTMLPSTMVLMDIDLPNKNGLELLKQIRAKSSWRKTPVIMLTGSSDVNDVKKSLQAGAVDYISKPFDIENFKQRLKKYLKN